MGAGTGRDYGCVITPTDSCRCNLYNETLRGEGVAEMRDLGCAFWYLLRLISEEQ